MGGAVAVEQGTRSTHVERVAASFPAGSEEHGVALFHDYLEDGGNVTEIPANVSLASIRLLTRDPGELYTEYIERLARSGDDVAIRVKLADARDNLARCRGEFDGYVNSNRARRYEWVIRRLESV
jgi:hypothetical protein